MYSALYEVGCYFKLQFQLTIIPTLTFSLTKMTAHQNNTRLIIRTFNNKVHKFDCSLILCNRFIDYVTWLMSLTIQISDFTIAISDYFLKHCRAIKILQLELLIRFQFQLTCHIIFLCHGRLVVVCVIDY